MSEISNLFKKCFLFLLLKTPNLKILSDNTALKIQKFFRKYYSHKVKLSDLELYFDTHNKNLINQAQQIVNDYGLVILKNFRDREETKLEGKNILNFVNSKYLYLDSDYHEFEDGSVMQREPYKIKGYDSFLDKNSTLINIRGRKNFDDLVGDDSGLIDIFHVKKVLPNENKKTIEDFEKDKILGKILRKINKKLYFKSVNFYFNKGKTDPRGLHIDTPTREFKLFLYLTDVSDSSDGPYTFVPKSNKRTFVSLLNMIVNKFSSSNFKLTDINFCDDSQALKILGNAGDLIISNQSAAHGGTVQDQDSSRLILVGIVH
jgi:hypothetical protein